jgi:hypothetical protein
MCVSGGVSDKVRDGDREWVMKNGKASDELVTKGRHSMGDI